MPFAINIAWRNWLGVLLPVGALVGALLTAVASLNGMASEANRIEGRLTTRSAEAAMRSNLRSLAESHGEYAVWDDAVRALYGKVDQQFVNQNYVASTASPRLFETVYLLDENGADIFGYRNGEKAGVSSAEAFGAALRVMAAKVPKDGRTEEVETGIVQTPWGLEAVAVGPVVANTVGLVDPPNHARLLIIARSLNDAAVERIGKSYVIPSLHIAAAGQGEGIPLVDPTGVTVAKLAWAPARLGSQASANVSPVVYLMFAFLIAAVGGVSLIAFRTFRRSDLLAEESVIQSRRLSGALASIPHGLCMFDAEKRLVFCNTLYASMYNLPPHLTEPGTPLQAIVDYRASIGNAPADFPNYVSHQGIEWTVGGPLRFEFNLQDGRAIRLSHVTMEGGSYIAVHEDVTAVAHAEKQLVQVARRDPLTGLANRIGFRESLAQAAKDVPSGGRLAVLSLDLDRFKVVNETLGAALGDTMLIDVAERLRSVAGADDLLARLGGDSFAIVQVGVEQPDGARRLAQAVIEALSKPYDVNGHKVSVGVSIGMALTTRRGGDVEYLQKHAEIALYWVKGHGRGAYQFFDPAMETAVQSQHQIAMGLRHAVERDELEVHYQPIVSLNSNSVAGFEALLRWRHPELGYIQPADFIPVAEETGLIVAIGEWVVRRACADAAGWPRDLHVAVNLSSVQFKDPHLVTTIFGALAASHLAAGRLELEITESVLLKDNQATVATLHQLRDFGVRIAMDDFGTGYSSLSYLRSFPFDKIKIDQSFIRDITTSPDALAIVRAVIGLSAEFGLTTVAEGVETQEQLAILRDAGCDEVQGFCFSEARPLAELGEFFLDPKVAGSIAA